MTAERVYAALLTLYPEPFRREYGGAMIEAFRDLSRAHPRRRLRLWRFVLGDACRSVGRAHLDACRSGVRRIVLQWVGACTLGIVATAVVGNVLVWCFSYLYHPYLDGSSIGLDVALSGGAIGAIGRGVVLGLCVAAGQRFALRARVPHAGWWILATAVAIPAGVLSCSSAMYRTFAAMHPLAQDVLTRTDRPELLSALAAMTGPTRWPVWPVSLLECIVMAASGLAIGVLTARSLGDFHAH
jgi:hypothetical protein